MRIKTLPELLSGRANYNNDNLHRIAISNLESHERRVIKWWCKKYGQPVKPLFDHTMEELIIEMLEDYYDAHPIEIDRFLASENTGSDWDGEMSDEYEADMQRRLAKINKKNRVDLDKYKSDAGLSPEEEQKILEGLGKELPKSNVKLTKGNEEVITLGQDEFEDAF